MDSTPIDEIEDQRIEELRETINHHYEAGKYEQALELIHELLRELPDDWHGLMRLSQCQLMQECFEEAEQAAKRLLEQDPHSDHVLLLLSQIYRNQAKWTIAIEYLEQAMTENPEWDVLHYNLAEILYRKENVSLAVEGYFTSRISPHYLKNQGRAEASLLKAMELSPGKMEHHALYGLVLDRLLRVDEAEAQFHQAITLDPMSPFSHAAYAEFLYIQGKFKEFRDHAHQALMLDPHDPMSKDLAAKLDAYEESPVNVLKSLAGTHRLRAKFSKNPAYHYLRAAMLMIEYGDLEPHKELKAYLRLVPDDQSVQLLYGKALFDSWRYLKAQRYFKALQKQYAGNAYAEEWLLRCGNVSFYRKYILYPTFFAIGKSLYYIFFPPIKLLAWPIYLYNRRKLIRSGAEQT
jgi:predicted Zn-dependent protease